MKAVLQRLADTPQRIAWPYIAGFFDGEGHISNPGRNTCARPAWRIGITQNDQRPLRAIQDFLLARGITSHIQRKGRGAHCSRLEITKGRDVASFLWGVRPYLIVKKQPAEDAWRMLQLWPPLSLTEVARLGGRRARIAKTQYPMVGIA